MPALLRPSNFGGALQGLRSAVRGTAGSGDSLYDNIEPGAIIGYDAAGGAIRKQYGAPEGFSGLDTAIEDAAKQADLAQLGAATRQADDVGRDTPYTSPTGEMSYLPKDITEGLMRGRYIGQEQEAGARQQLQDQLTDVGTSERLKDIQGMGDVSRRAAEYFSPAGTGMRESETNRQLDLTAPKYNVQADKLVNDRLIQAMKGQQARDVALANAYGRSQAAEITARGKAVATNENRQEWDPTNADMLEAYNKYLDQMLHPSTLG
jgi:hypothetical protein